LTELAELGSGSYAFIPDSGFVGTVFVNAISNLLVTMARSAVLVLEPLGDSEFAEDFKNSRCCEALGQPELAEPCVLGSHLITLPSITQPGIQFQDGKTPVQINVGTLQFGQSKDIVVRMRLGASKPQVPAKRMPFGRYKDKNDGLDASPVGRAVSCSPYLSATLKYTVRNSEGAAKECTTDMTASMQTLSAEVEVHRHRLTVTSGISHALSLALKNSNQLEEAQKFITDIAASIRASDSAEDERIQELLKDLDGQVSEALSCSKFFDKWGKHYLPSLRLAHLHQQCNNFKDPGVQHYVSDFFNDIRDAAEEIFQALPAPTPTLPASRGSVAAPQSMSVFYNVGGGCFDGECAVAMADGSHKPLNTVSQGEYVKTATGNAKVQCVVKTVCTGGKTQLVQLPGGLLATPWHPVRVAGDWCFPCDLANATLRTCPAVYNLVLQGNHPSMCVSGVECSVLGHGLKDPVVAHEFFGTNLVLEHLQKMPGWESGLVELVPESYVRDPATGRVCGLTVDVVERNPVAFPCKVDLENTGVEGYKTVVTCA